MHLEKTQKGMTSLGWLGLLIGGGFVLVCLFRMTPAYLDDRYIQEALRSLSEQPGVTEMTNGEIRKILGNSFRVNNISSQSPKDATIERKRDYMIISINYEVRVPLVYNVSAVMSFNNVWDSRRPYECCKPDSE